MYFKNFPKFLYDYDIKGERRAFVVTDITRNVRFRRDVLANISVYDEYDVRDGETPEIVAERFYGNAEYHWVVMLANQRFDYREDWVKDYYSLSSFIVDKYGTEADGVHHYEDAKGHVVPSDYPGAVSISNRQYEEDLNEQKRRIRLVSPNLLNKILTNYEQLL